MSRRLFFCFAALLFFFIAVLCDASSSGIVKKGNQYYKKGDYAAAVENYMKALDKNPNSDIINFNVGTALYQQGEYENAVGYLQKTLLTDDARLRQQAVYNLGNTFYQQGKARENQDINFAVSALEKSLEGFQKAIELDQGDEDAQHNYEFVKKELEKLKQQQQQDKNCPLPKKEDSSKDSQGEDQPQDQRQGSQQEQQKKNQPQSPDQGDSSNQEPQGQQDEEKSDTSQGDSSPQSSQNGIKDNFDRESRSSSLEESASLTQKQAEAALVDYQQNEEPKGLLYFLNKPSSDNTAEKDW